MNLHNHKKTLDKYTLQNALPDLVPTHTIGYPVDKYEDESSNTIFNAPIDLDWLRIELSQVALLLREGKGQEAYVSALSALMETEKDRGS